MITPWILSLAVHATTPSKRALEAQAFSAFQTDNPTAFRVELGGRLAWCVSHKTRFVLEAGVAPDFGRGDLKKNASRDLTDGDQLLVRKLVQRGALNVAWSPLIRSVAVGERSLGLRPTLLVGFGGFRHNNYVISLDSSSNSVLTPQGRETRVGFTYGVTFDVIPSDGTIASLGWRMAPYRDLQPSYDPSNLVTKKTYLQSLLSIAVGIRL